MVELEGRNGNARSKAVINRLRHIASRNRVVVPLQVSTNGIAAHFGVQHQSRCLNRPTRQHHYIGFMLIVGRDQAIGLEEAGNALRIVFVHLTPVGANDVAAGHN